MMRSPLSRKLLSSFKVILLLCAMQVYAAGNEPVLAKNDLVRYAEIERRIKRNRHLNGHFVLAVDARTIKAVRGNVGLDDITILVQMMGDKDHGVALAASMLLVTLGKQAAPALTEAAVSENSAIANQAQGALRLMDDCYQDERRVVMNSDICPATATLSKPSP